MLRIRVVSRIRIVSLLLLGAIACGDSPSEPPAQLEGFYYAVSVNGQSFPRNRIDWFSTDLGNCERDMTGADLVFSGETEFHLAVQYRLRCEGQQPNVQYTSQGGVYLRNGTTLDMQPFNSTADVIVGGELRGSSVFVTIRHGDTDYRLRFEDGD